MGLKENKTEHKGKVSELREVDSSVFLAFSSAVVYSFALLTFTLDSSSKIWGGGILSG